MNNKPKGDTTIAEKLQNSMRQIGQIVCTRKFWMELIIMTAGMFVAAMGVYFFLIPSKLIIGSITGLSLVLAKLLPFVSVGTMIFIINAILLVLSFLLIDNEFGAKTVYTALILGPMIDFIGSIVPVHDSLFTTYIAGQAVANPWFDLLCFVLVLSASQSILFSINASTGGLDILAKIFNKYLHVKLGTAVMLAGGAICCTAFAINPVELVIIGLIGTWLNGLILNHFMADINSKTRVYIISKDYQKIQDFVINHINRGVTLHEVIGGYSHEKQIQLEIVLTKEEFSTLIDFMSKEKLSTFITSDIVSEVYGLWNKKGLLRTGEY
jgi:hypothetical protein